MGLLEHFFIQAEQIRLRFYLLILQIKRIFLIPLAGALHSSV